MDQAQLPVDDVSLRVGSEGESGDRPGGRDQPGGFRAGGLRHACLSHFVREVHGDQAEWKRQLKGAPTRVQWDPERDLHLNPLPYRSLQLGLAGEATVRYADEWIVGIEDVTGLAREVHGLVRAGELGRAAALLPEERPYPVAEDVVALSTAVGHSWI